MVSIFPWLDRKIFIDHSCFLPERAQCRCHLVPAFGQSLFVYTTGQLLRSRQLQLKRQPVLDKRLKTWTARFASRINPQVVRDIVTPVTAPGGA